MIFREMIACGKSLAFRVALLALLAIIGCSPRGADKSVIHHVSVTAALAPDGSAAIEETWDMTISNGTENYKQLFGMKNERLDGFSVSENGVPYQRVDPWNTDLSRAQKAGRYGINKTKSGPELCWGIGTENGRRVYKIRYGLRDMVTLHDDEDGSVKAALYWQFISKKFQRAERVDVRVVPPGSIGPDHHFWIFGFNGAIGVKSNDCHIQADNVRLGHFVELGLIMPAGDFPRAKRVDYAKLDAIRKNGRSGDDLGNFNATAPRDFLKFTENKAYLQKLGAAFLFVMFICFVIRIPSSRPRAPIEKHAPRSVPPEETLEAIAHLLSVFHKAPELLNTFMITWIYKKHIRIEPGSGVLDGSQDSDTKICLDSRPECFDGPFEKRLFTIVAGGLKKQGGSSAETYRRYLKRQKTNETLRDIDSGFIGASEQYCLDRGWIAERTDLPVPRKIWGMSVLFCVPLFVFGLSDIWILAGASLFFVWFILLPCVLRQRYKLTPEGQKVHGDVLGFANYLCNYSQLEKRGAEHIELWDSYMAFAHLLGIADKVEKELLKIFPPYETNSPCSAYVHSSAHIGSSRSSYCAESSSGGGGGGGGGSGGGGGGGTR